MAHSDSPPEFEAKTITIVSGKGGSGKSLFAAVLGRALAREGMRVLLVDADVYVRGLTILLTKELDRGPTGSGISFTDTLEGNLSLGEEHQDSGASKLPREPLIERFFECDLWPAVANITEPFPSIRNMRSNLGRERRMLESAIQYLSSKYDIIIVDNRAGVDAAVFSSAWATDITIAVTESDAVAQQTHANLLETLRRRVWKGSKRRADSPSLYSVINKSPGIHSYSNLSRLNAAQANFNYLGIIPFDGEVMAKFGDDNFWWSVFETLYFRSIIDVWNELAKRENLSQIKSSRYRFPPSIYQTGGLNRFAFIERIAIFYGGMSLVAAIGLYAYSQLQKFDLDQNPIQLMISLLVAFATICLFIGLVLRPSSRNRLLVNRIKQRLDSY